MKENSSLRSVGQRVTPEMEGFRKAWLGSKALHPLPKIEAMP